MARSLLPITKRGFAITAAILLALISLVSLAKSAEAAGSLYFRPASGSFTAGQTFSVGVYVSSLSGAMNAAEGVISFPKDKIEVVSLSKNGTIFNFWVQEPSFSNAAGTVNFEGVILNPGFTGPAGKVITVNFRARTAGSAPVSFSQGSILANDGKGTNILSSLGSANYFTNSGSPALPKTGKEKEFAINTALTPPTITEYPEKVQSSDPLVIKGITDYPNTQIALLLQRGGDEPKRYSSSSTPDSNFNFVINGGLEPGTYTIWAEVIDDSGAKSNPSDKKIINVEKSPFLRISSFLINTRQATTLLAVLLVLLLLRIGYGWRGLLFLRRKLKQDIKEADSTTRQIFWSLRDYARRRVKFHKDAEPERELTSAEAELIIDLEESLDKAEQLITKKLENIEENIK